MSLVGNEGLSAADIAAVTGNANGGFGNFSGDGGWWFLVLLFFAMNGGWGNGYGGNAGGVVPSIDNSMQRGFDQSAIMSGLGNIQNAITSGYGDTQLGIAGVNQNISTTGNSIVAAITASQMAAMQNAFNMQSQFADCCCENRLGIANLGADIAREACADRQAVSEGLMNLTAQNNANTNALMNTINGGIQSIKDQMCQDKIDAKNEEIANLRQQINMQNLAASQAAQTAQLIADNNAQTQYVVNRVAPYPVPSYNVPNPYAYNGFTGACGFATA